MNVVIYSRTPIAGQAWQQYHCLKKYTDLNVRLINEMDDYHDGRVFPSDIMLNDETNDEIIDLIKAADVIHIHNYLPKRHIREVIDKNKQLVIITLHSVPKFTKWEMVRDFAHKAFTIRQPYQIHEYKDLPTLPNLFDYYEVDNNTKIFPSILFAPTNKLPLRCQATKGFTEVSNILKKIKKQFPKIDINIMEGIPYLENLKIKSKYAIIIDDVIHNTFHTTSIEAAAASSVCLTGVGREEGYPFIKTSLGSLEKTLKSIIGKGVDFITEMGKESREWVELKWNPKNLVNEYTNAYSKIIK